MRLPVHGVLLALSSASNLQASSPVHALFSAVSAFPGSFWLSLRWSHLRCGPSSAFVSRSASRPGSAMHSYCCLPPPSSIDVLHNPQTVFRATSPSMCGNLENLRQGHIIYIGFAS
ncbi:hypothetical protein B0H14DRAFT_2821138 [Mycena olivaceomarginata]|nr:hypothetical protein B0H14DRAFT_2821138 [Mycena olivaceomarginata]